MSVLRWASKNPNLRDDPWSGLSYSIVHDDKENKGSPIANFYEDGGVVGTLLYESEEELITSWKNEVNKQSDQI